MINGTTVPTGRDNAYSSDEVTRDIQTGRTIYADEDKYNNDEEYKARIDKYVKEGFHLNFGTPDQPSSGGSGGGSSALPEVTSEDDGKVLTVVDGAWDAAPNSGGSGSTVAPNWNENDPTSAAYIKNRPFYDGYETPVLLDEDIEFMARTNTCLYYSVNSTFSTPIPITNAISLSVDDVVVEVPSPLPYDMGNYYIGAANPGDSRITANGVGVAFRSSGEQLTGIGFVMLSIDAWEPGTHHVQLLGEAVEVLVTIPPKFIPSTIDLENGAGSGSIMQKSAVGAYGDYSFAEGNSTTGNANDASFGQYAHAEGYSTLAQGNYSHAEGWRASAYGDESHAEGYQTIARKGHSHAEGLQTRAEGAGSHSEGKDTHADGDYSHAEGQATTAGGEGAHAEGDGASAPGDYSHAEGKTTRASGKYSHAEGYVTTANHRSQHVFGEFNILDPSTAQATAKGSYIELVGNGTSTTARSNARTLDWSGNEALAGSLTLGKGTADEVTITAAQLKALLGA